ncbi:uncharacterized protein EI90DRAFT_3013026 [Cantharellus anzutake]|uniref:uncharacterized protein n=1 Tax=Cantharellus anzutake TaxID=1750568 RepID=UPI00190355E0|nr:uncharacterized protein EI90DRAFT_3013026 [Cantharellus anzutake]KAF8338904.1 hypothetical protein EI90DRAFT_3013026 [Cantharellus anzutake]
MVNVNVEAGHIPQVDTDGEEKQLENEEKEVLDLGDDKVAVLLEDLVEMKVPHGSESILTHLTLTPGDGRTEDVEVTRLSGDCVFTEHHHWNPDIVDCLYDITMYDGIDKSAVVSIKCFLPSDGRFIVGGDPKSLRFRESVGSMPAGIVKSMWQWEKNYLLFLVPLTQIGHKHAKEVLTLYSNKNVKLLYFEKDAIRMNAFESNFSSCIFDPWDEYSIDHTEMAHYEDTLEPGDVVIADCYLEQFKEKETNLEKVAFKLIGISHICSGEPPRSDVSMLGCSLSKKKSLLVL